jgi:hypothetical protein
VIAEQLDAAGHLIEDPMNLTDYNNEQKRQHELKQQQRRELLASLPGTLYRAPMFQNKLSSRIKSRKPAIKYPARHQWQFCAEDYDPMALSSSAPQPLPPYAPLKAYTKDYPRIMQQTMPKFHKNRWALRSLVAQGGKGRGGAIKQGPCMPLCGFKHLCGGRL